MLAQPMLSITQMASATVDLDVPLSSAKTLSSLTTSASPAYPALSLMVRYRFYGLIVDTTGNPIPCHKMPKILGTSLTR